jgi:hypothetical protein
VAYFGSNFSDIGYDNDRPFTITATNIKDDDNNKNNEHVEPHARIATADILS